ncbi:MULTISPECIES: serine hydrolase domain-containing protein [unclassified Psychrobacter]|uniref:serine hydrolase domain-containing protein n=1 Tax=unclassified Psychrobacter TaxID=196806 RepID=UPI0025B530CA|nr:MULTISPECIES: serine hydrolase domain-containing protein [unclassified Psychrobacter]MDN3452748.1 serine hydrolase domain-containing protein [Psychrobacter sp. APC 3350]MDN3501536.1 serine hydrolase domain-containing protein [Psychrobacter sp. 5A.1]
MDHNIENSNTSINADFQNKLQQLLTDLQLDDAPAGGAVAVYQAGQCIAQASVGLARPDMSWRPDSLAINFSTGKGVLATLVHVLVSQQLLEYDEPIAHYWPAFAANGKDQITLRQIMSHQADLFSIQSLDVDSKMVLDWHTMLSHIADMPITQPEDAASYDSAYSALVYGWILGGVVEAVTHLSLAEALRRYLTAPLGIADSCYFGVPDSKVDQVAKLAKNFVASTEDNTQLRNKRQKPTLKADSQSTLHTYASLPSYACWQQQSLVDSKVTDPSKDSEQNKLPILDTAHISRLYFNTSQLNLKNYKAALIPAGKQALDYHNRQTLQAVIPAANGVASAQALATIYAMLANGGVWQGKTLIDSTTFEQLSTPQVSGLDAVMPAAMQWRLGYHRLFSVCSHNSNNDKKVDPALSGFGHMGYNGSVAWCDPERQLSFAFIHNFDTTMLNDIRQFALTEAVLSWVEEMQ